MSNQHTTLVLNLIVGVLAISGIAVVLVGFPLGAFLLALAVVIALAQRSELAHALRQTTPSQRRHRFAAAALLAVSAGAVLVVAFNDEEWGDTGAIIYNVLFLALAISSVGCFLVALAGRRSHGQGSIAS